MSSCLLRALIDSIGHWFNVSGRPTNNDKNLTTIFNQNSFGVVVAFVTNSYMHDGVQNATTTARQGVEDSQRFLKTTSNEASHLLNQNYNELNNHLTFMLKGLRIDTL